VKLKNREASSSFYESQGRAGYYLEDVCVYGLLMIFDDESRLQSADFRIIKCTRTRYRGEEKGKLEL
jgi:hypothetical protein